MAVKRIVSDFFSNYLAETAPSLKGIDTSGMLSLDISMTSVDKKLAARGTVKLRAASLTLPAISLDLKGLDIDIPFDLAAKGDKGEVNPGLKGDGSDLGWITISGFRKGEYTLSELKIPVIASGNDYNGNGRDLCAFLRRGRAGQGPRGKRRSRRIPPAVFCRVCKRHRLSPAP